MSPTQLDLFSKPTFGTLVRDIKIAMDEAIKKTGHSRDEVCDRMNALASRHGVRLNNGNAKELTKDTLEKWLNLEEDGRMPPVKALSIFCAVVQSIEPLNKMAMVLGAMFIEDEDIKLLRWAKAQWSAKQTRQVIRKLEDEINGR